MIYLNFAYNLDMREFRSAGRQNSVEKAGSYNITPALFEMADAASSTAPLVTAPQLHEYKRRNIMFIGKVAQVRGKIVDLDGGNHPATVRVKCQRDARFTHVRQGMKVLVRAFVKKDLSLDECTGYSPTLLGDGFDISLSNASAVTTTSPKFRDIFS